MSFTQECGVTGAGWAKPLLSLSAGAVLVGSVIGLGLQTASMAGDPTAAFDRGDKRLGRCVGWGVARGSSRPRRCSICGRGLASGRWSERG